MLYLPNIYKRCSKCKKVHPRTIEYFCKESRVNDGLSARCRQCHYAAVDDYESRHPNAKNIRTVRWQGEQRKAALALCFLHCWQELIEQLINSCLPSMML